MTYPILFILSLKALLSSPTQDTFSPSPASEVRGLNPGSTEEYCQWEMFNATCSGRDQVVLMLEARYGRMKFGRCMREDHGSVGCYADVLRVMDEKCSGQRSCTVGVPDATLHNTHPCPKELMPYLEANYLCITASVWKRRKCTDDGGEQNRPQSSSSSSSSTVSSSSPPPQSSSSSSPETDDAHTGGLVINLPVAANRRQTHLKGTGGDDDDYDDGDDVTRCPWIVQVPQGQKINLTLFTFSRQSTTTTTTTTTTNGNNNFNKININTLSNNSEIHQQQKQKQQQQQQQQFGSDCYLQLTVLESGVTQVSADETSVSVTPDPLVVGLCLSGARQAKIYESRSNRLEVTVYMLRHYHPGYNLLLFANQSAMDQTSVVSGSSRRQQANAAVGVNVARFLLHYEALGCPDLLNVTNADVKRSGGNVSIKCLFNSDTFYLTCRGNTWIGERLTCPGGRFVPLKSSTLYTYGVLTAIGLVVALMVSCVVVIAFSSIAFLRKRSNTKSPSNPIQDPLLKSPAIRFKKDTNYESGGDVSDKHLCRYHHHHVLHLPHHQQQLHHCENSSLNSCEQLDTIEACNTPDCLLQLHKSEKQSLLHRQQYQHQKPQEVLCRDGCGYTECGSKVLCNCQSDYPNECLCCNCHLVTDPATGNATRIEFANDPLILYSTFAKTNCPQQVLTTTCGNLDRQLSCRQQLQQRACYCVTGSDQQRGGDNIPSVVYSLQQQHANNFTAKSLPHEFVSLDLIKDYNSARTDTTPGDQYETTFSLGRITCQNKNSSDQSEIGAMASVMATNEDDINSTSNTAETKTNISES